MGTTEAEHVIMTICALNATNKKNLTQNNMEVAFKTVHTNNNLYPSVITTAAKQRTIAPLGRGPGIYRPSNSDNFATSSIKLG